jgi:hypothetical protein
MGPGKMHERGSFAGFRKEKPDNAGNSFEFLTTIEFMKKSINGWIFIAPSLIMLSRRMAKQKFRPTRLGGFSGTKAYVSMSRS